MRRRILIPLDGSAHAEGALYQLEPLLREKETEVLLLGVINFHASPGNSSVPMLKNREQDILMYLRRTGERLGEKGIRVEQKVQVGLAAETILNTAAEEGATMIVLSTHGESGESGWAFGSVTERIIRGSLIPVFVVRAFQKGPSGDLQPTRKTALSIKNILLPISRTEVSLGILPCVKEIALQCDARITLLHILDSKSLNWPGELAEERLRLAGDELTRAGVPTEVVFRKGLPASEIVQVAQRDRFDLLAISTHARSGLSRWALGSVTEKVLRAIDLPALVVRPARHRPKIEHSQN